MAASEIAHIAQTLKNSADVEVGWLYGSRASGTHDNTSDYDLALALMPNVTNREYALENIRYTLSCQLTAPVSVVDINQIPTPLAQNVISDGQVLICKSDFRLRAEQQRVWSLWEAYKYEHEHNRQAL